MADIPLRKRFSSWLAVPPGLGTISAFANEPDAELIWRTLHLLTEIPERGLALFSGNQSENRVAWAEFSSYLAQAETYYRVATQTEDVSSALLYYYAFLNLAKAELLTSPSHGPQVLHQRIRHGLIHDPAGSHALGTLNLRTAKGVFPLLYEKRTGLMPKRSTWPLKRLLACCPDIGWEIYEVGISESRVASLFHVVVAEGKDVWPIIALSNSGPLVRSKRSLAYIAKSFRRVRFTQGWRETFGFGSRYLGDHVYFESIDPMPLDSQITAQGAFTVGLNIAMAYTWQRLAPLIDHAHQPGVDAFVVPTFFEAEMTPMPPALASYAVMFYLSSLVRYRPSELGSGGRPKVKWLLTAFPHQAALPLLHSFLNNITGTTYLFSGPSARP